MKEPFTIFARISSSSFLIEHHSSNHLSYYFTTFKLHQSHFRLAQKLQKKIYFASDLHLGVDTKKTSREREERFVAWLDAIKSDMSALYLVGDIFDYWYEYKHTIPKGFIRILGKLAELKDLGIEIFIFTGNHDLWMNDYFTEEMDIPVYHKPISLILGTKQFFIGHGDGLGPADRGYKILKSIMTNKICQWLFSRIHPNTAISLMKYFSKKSRESTEEEAYLGPDKEWLILFSESHLKAHPEIDYYIFGHRHLPIDFLLSNGKSRYVNLGDWTNYYSFACFDGIELSLAFYQNDNQKIYGR